MDMWSLEKWDLVGSHWSWLEVSHTQPAPFRRRCETVVLKSSRLFCQKPFKRRPWLHLLWLINFKLYIFLLSWTFSFQFYFLPFKHQNPSGTANARHPGWIHLLIAYLFFFFPLPFCLSEETTCLLSLCFWAGRMHLKMLLLPCHYIMLFGGGISWNHGKEDCCSGSFISYSPYDSQNCIVPSQRGKIGLSCKLLVLF